MCTLCKHWKYEEKLRSGKHVKQEWLKCNIPNTPLRYFGYLKEFNRIFTESQFICEDDILSCCWCFNSRGEGRKL